MKPQNSGKISEHFSGLGTITEETVARRARELAQIDGRSEYNDADWAAAKKELLGVSASTSSEKTIAAVTRWDEEPGSSGRQAPVREAADEQTVAEGLVREGVEEAAHDQMLEGSKAARPES